MKLKKFENFVNENKDWKIFYYFKNSNDEAVKRRDIDDAVRRAKDVDDFVRILVDEMGYLGGSLDYGMSSELSDELEDLYNDTKDNLGI